MKANKYTVVMVLAIIITAALLIFCQAAPMEATTLQEQPQATLVCQEYKQFSWNAGDSEKQLVKQETAGKDVLIHNDGNAMQTDVFADGKAEGNYLVGVYYTEQNGVPVESYYFTNEPDGDKAALLNRVANNEEALQTRDAAEISSMKGWDGIKSYNWEYKNNAALLARLSTTVALHRESSTAAIDEKSGSVWNVATLTQLERDKAVRINGYCTKLSVAGADQKLLSYGPIGDKTGGFAEVSMIGEGLPSINNSFSIEGFSAEDLSSLADSYGRWNFRDKVGRPMAAITTKPAIRATNTSENFRLELSHGASLISPSGTSLADTYQTGVIRINVNDRSA